MGARGYPGYWLVFVVAAGAAFGVLALAGVDAATRKPWAIVPALVGIGAAELIAVGVLGWRGPEPEPRSSRVASIALVGVGVSVAVLVGALVIYGLTDSAVAAWAAFIGLLSTFICRWATEY